MAEYREKVINNPSPENIERYRMIYKDLFEINRRILLAIIDIDRNAITLTEWEKKRINDDEQRDRIIERVIPFMLLSQDLELYADGH